MNRKQRVLSAIRRENTDCLPIQLDITDRALGQLSEAWGFPIEDNTLQSVLDQHLFFARQIPFQTQGDRRKSETVDAWGVRWAADAEGGWVLEHPLAGLDDLRKYHPGNVIDRIDWEKVSGNIKQYQESACVTSYQNALLFERAWSLLGFERLLYEMVDQPLAVETFLDTITEIQCAIARRYIELGIQVARTGDDWGSQRGMLFSPPLWRRMIKPRLETIWKIYQAHGIPIIHHSCGDIKPVIGDLIELGLDVLNPVQPEVMDVSFIAKEYGKHLSFYGGISVQNTLPYGNPEDIHREVKFCVQNLGQYGGYIIAPAQAVTSDIPAENVQALLEAMQTYRVMERQAL